MRGRWRDDGPGGAASPAGGRVRRKYRQRLELEAQLLDERRGDIPTLEHFQAGPVVVELLVVGLVVEGSRDHHPQFAHLGELVGGVDGDGVGLSLRDSIAKACLPFAIRPSGDGSETAPTSSATRGPKRVASSSWLTPASSMTSCSTPAATTSSG